MGVSLDAFDDHVRPTLPGVRIGARVRFLREDLDAWAKTHREAPSEDLRNLPCASAAGSGTTDSRSPASGTLARRVNELEDELKAYSPRGGTRRTGRSARSLQLVRR